MPLNLPTPITYLITSGEAKQQTSDADFVRILSLIKSAVESGITLIQIREKNLSGEPLFELVSRAVLLTNRSSTRLLVNDRADIAQAAGADGVHLTTRSIDTVVIRRTFGEDFVIGVSTHSIEEARTARDGGADFVVFGPIFETPSKREYGQPLGAEKLREAASSVKPFPVVAIGGISIENARACLEAGAAGVAGITLFSNPESMKQTRRIMSDML